jgi:uncharacterized protein
MSPHAHTGTSVSVADLVGHPGTSRPIDATFAAPDDLDLPLVEAVGPLRLDGVLDSVVEGILVRGEVTGELTAQCARCLTDVSVELTADVAELFVDPADPRADAEPEAGYTVVDGVIDLDTLLRDALAPAVPVAPLCRPDCAGLCPTCGVDRNTTACDCAENAGDPRWGALAGLRVEHDQES